MSLLGNKEDDVEPFLNKIRDMPTVRDSDTLKPVNDEKDNMSFFSRVKSSAQGEIFVDVIFTLAFRFLISYFLGLISPELDSGLLSHFIWSLTTIFGIWFAESYNIKKKN